MFLDVLPAVVLFGIGITLVVAPLTTTLMGSVPVANAGLGSAINNAVSRVGSPLLLAMLYIVITVVFYGSLGRLVPSMDTDSNAVRAAVQPLNPPPAGTDPQTATAIDQASTDAFRIVMLVDAGLLARRRRGQRFRAATRAPGSAGRGHIHGRTAGLTRPHGLVASEPVDVPGGDAGAGQEGGHDPFREVRVQRAAEHQPEVDRPDQQLGRDADIGIRPEVTALDAASR